jgi:hypothetical protein
MAAWNTAVAAVISEANEPLGSPVLSNNTGFGATIVFMLWWWWLIGALVALALCAGIWALGSFVYLKIHYPRMSERERVLFTDLDKEQRTPRSGSL